MTSFAKAKRARSVCVIELRILIDKHFCVCLQKVDRMVAKFLRRLKVYPVSDEIISFPRNQICALVPTCN